MPYHLKKSRMGGPENFPFPGIGDLEIVPIPRVDGIFAPPSQ